MCQFYHLSGVNYAKYFLRIDIFLRNRGILIFVINQSEINPATGKSEEVKTTVAILCETTTPTLKKSPKPILENDQPKCASGTENLSKN